MGIRLIIEMLKSQRHRSTTRANYYAVWKVFNNFIIRLDCKPKSWEDRLTLFVGHLVQSQRKSTTVKSTIRAVLQEVNVELQEDRFLITALTKACRLRNDVINVKLPIQKAMLAVLLKKLQETYSTQPYLRDIYRALLSTAYFGLFRVGELTLTPAAHQVLARNVHIGVNKDKILFMLRSSKTHDKGSNPQMIKISSLKGKKDNVKLRTGLSPPCPFIILRKYRANRGCFRADSDPFFIFRDNQPVTAVHFRLMLRNCLESCGFDSSLYKTHSLHIGRSCDLYKCGLSIGTIQKLGRWRSNVVFKYLQNCY